MTKQQLREYKIWRQKRYPNVFLTLINIELIVEGSFLFTLLLFLFGCVSFLAPVLHVLFLFITYKMASWINKRMFKNYLNDKYKQ